MQNTVNDLQNVWHYPVKLKGMKLPAPWGWGGVVFPLHSGRGVVDQMGPPYFKGGGGGDRGWLSECLPHPGPPSEYAIRPAAQAPTLGWFNAVLPPS